MKNQIKYLLSVVLMFGVVSSNLFAQSNDDPKEHHELDEYKTERTIKMAEEDKSENQLNVDSGLLAVNSTELKSISNSSLKADSKKFRNGGDKVNNSEKKKNGGEITELKGDFGVIATNEFFESNSSGSSGSNAGGHCSEPSIVAY